MLIVIEGLDGSGKSTQVELLKKFIESKNKSAVYMHFPRYNDTASGYIISKYLRGDYGNIKSLDPHLVAYLFAMDRYESLQDLNKLLSEYDVVILDRYVFSNIAYQCAKIEDESKRNAMFDWIYYIEFDKLKLPKPNLSLFIDAPLSFINKTNMSSREYDSDRAYLNGKHDIHEASIKFQETVRSQYIDIIYKTDDLLYIDPCDENGNMMSVDDISGMINKMVDNCF